MLNQQLRSYIANLPIEAPHFGLAAELEPQQPADLNKLPDAVVTGSSLIQFPPEATPEVRSCVALSLLAAQKVATNDHVILTPEQWIERHKTVLMNLGWLSEGGSTVKYEFKDLDAAVHEAIIPFLAAAFAPVVAAGSLILTALKQLKEMDKNSSWITLFDRQSRRFDITEYQFSIVQVTGPQVHLKMASVRFGAAFGKTQVLFVKVSQSRASFETVSQSFSAQADLLAEMNSDLKVKLGGLTRSYIQSIPDELLQGEPPEPAPEKVVAVAAPRTMS